MLHTILNGRYQVLRELGSGGMAEVYEGVDLLLDRDVAIKVLHPSYRHDHEFIERFKREARNTAILSHPNIVGVYDVGSDGKNSYMVMEFIEGPTLKQSLTKFGPLVQEEAIVITIQLLKGLNHAHGYEIIHRDIKPHNIMLDAQGLVKITDFGISLSTTSATLTRTGEIMGTVHYFSPEQARGKKVSFASDLYSVGIVLYEMVTGQLPFNGEESVGIVMQHLLDPVPDLKEIDPTLSDELCEVIYKALAKDPEQRYQTAAEMIQALQQVQKSIHERETEGDGFLQPENQSSASIIQHNLATADANIILASDQTLRLSEVGYSILSLDSVKAEDEASGSILANTQEGLVRLGKDNEIQMGIAEKIEFSPDYKCYTFYLRKNAKWNDGMPVTAYDFEYAWKRVLDPSVKSNNAYRFYSIELAEEYRCKQVREGESVRAEQVGITAVDEYTLKVQLKIPMINFIRWVTDRAFLPQRRDIVEKYGEKYGTTPEYVVYNGPFRIKSLSSPRNEATEKQTVVLVKNEDYWDRENVHLQTIIIDYLSSLENQFDPIVPYNKGEVDFARLTNNAVQVLSGSKELTTKNYSAVCFMFFNLNHPFFQNEKIRKAISLAIDRDLIVNFRLCDSSLPAGSLIPPEISDSDNHSFRRVGEIVEADQELAKQYFREGLEELGLSYPPIDISLGSRAFRWEMAESIRQQLSKVLNWRISLKDYGSFEEHLATRKKGEYDLAFFGWFPDYNDPMTFFEMWQSDNPWNLSKLHDPVYDQLIEQAKLETDLQKRSSLLHQAESYLVGTGQGERAAFVPLFYQGQAYVQKPYVKELYTHPFTYKYSFKWAYIEKH